MSAATVNPTLYCPIRGALKAKVKAKDGLTFTEEKLRIDCIKHLLALSYPKNRIQTETVVLRFGHKGMNALRADVVVYDRSASEVAAMKPDQLRLHIVIIAEIKRDNKSAQSAKEDQLIPALGLVPRDSVLGIYWDDVEQVIFYKEVAAGVTALREASISHLPQYGSKFSIKPIRHSDLRPSQDLEKVFSRFDNVLHQAGHDLEERYELLLQIILVKIYDEQRNKVKNNAMIIQDFSSKSMSATDKDVVAAFNSALESSLVLYQKNLGKPIEKELNIKGTALRHVCKVLCRIDLLGSSPHVMQDFYMYFARHIYKVDLAQYFTPYEIVDFIVRITNPRFGDRVKDPACGSADFLVAAYRIAMDRHDADIADQVHGADSGIRAVQISVLNMILNGDGRSNVVKEDSLAEIDRHEDAYTLMLCNPPFGKDIVERRPTILAKFELSRNPKTDEPFKEQETGILFVEVCVRSVRPGQRVAIILPNGYLGNRSERYAALRRWLLQRVRIAAVIGFPRFTFKKAGADVSASVVIMEKLGQYVDDPTDVPDYPIHFNLLNKVGWDVRNKRAEKVYKVSEVDGSPILDQDNNGVIDADFGRVLDELYASPVVDAFPWIVQGLPSAGVNDGWAVPASTILADSAMILDPKRWSEKYQSLTAAIGMVDHFTLGDVLEFVSSKQKRSTKPEDKSVKAKRSSTAVYRYVEIAQIYENFGAYDWELHRGWNLPGRAKHVAQPGDVFIAHIWSSAGKWFMAGADAAGGDLVVTSGCYHLRVRPGMEEFLPDLVFGLSTEAFRVQMRALATGSDGLSVVSEEDLMAIILPRVTCERLRSDLSDRIESWMAAGMSIARLVQGHVENTFPDLDVPHRPSHVAQV